MNRIGRVYTLLFALGLFAFSLFALLDTFVIAREYAPAESGHYEAETGTVQDSALLRAVSNSEPTVTSDSYSDEQLAIKLETYRYMDTDIYVADVALSSPEYILTAFAEGTFGRNIAETASQTAGEAGAILAINGDNYGSRRMGYVIRNGVLYREEAAGDQEDLVIWGDGSMEIVEESEITARELLAQGAVHVLSFGPGLLENGEILVSEEDEVGRAMASNPRTALGVRANGHYVFVVADGRTSESEGLSLRELAEFLSSIGVETAYNLDGGGSSTMVFLGDVVNEPTSGHGIRERAVTDIVYIGKGSAL